MRRGKGKRKGEEEEEGDEITQEEGGEAELGAG